MSTPYERINAFKRRLRDEGKKVTVKDLLALAAKNDPFYSGTATDTAKAEWFAGLWERFDFTDGVHLRRIHYRVVIEPGGIRKSDGVPYENTEADWNHLNDASKHARYQGLVAATAFVDRRNPAAHVHFPQPESPNDRDVYLDDEEPDWSLPRIQADLALNFGLDLPFPVVGGYDYHPSDQPFHIELWVEKTTMNDVLDPVCRDLGINLVTAAGFQSITNVIGLLERAAAHGKPVRIFFISDFDPAGDSMPVAAARQIEYWSPRIAPGIDIKLTSLVLTAQQVAALHLPRTPVKDSDLRKAGFEASHGEGAVELDALEALYPGELAALLREAVRPYRDDDLPSRKEHVRRETRARVDDLWDAMTAAEQDELRSIEASTRRVYAGYARRLEELAGGLDADLQPLDERLGQVRQAIRSKADRFVVTLPEVEPETEQVDESGWLFASERDYMDQLDHYQARKANGKAAS